MTAMASPAPPATYPSSAMTVKEWVVRSSRSSCSGRGFRHLRSITVGRGEIPRLLAVFLALSMSSTVFPYPMRAHSLPFSSISGFRISGAEGASREFPFFRQGTAVPLAKRIIIGPSCFPAKRKRRRRASSSRGAVRTRFGTGLDQGMSKSPWWVSPSSPTRPALSTAKTTGRFCMQTSCTTWSMAR
ncbi:hypothetical protein SDC9_59590 [bioreactor metagenome]|uniref:Uncharacterized protein n=1 Tax=bioreactor metagenome TaxID=1076179 RepID=A0A644XGJ4_9ZZZZ